jgi:hypothetical protein
MSTHVDELLVLQVQELVELNSSVRVLLEGTLPLQLSGLAGVGKSGISLWEPIQKQSMISLFAFDGNACQGQAGSQPEKPTRMIGELFNDRWFRKTKNRFIWWIE